jgi:hypothetical protein
MVKSSEERRTGRRFGMQLPVHFRVSQRTANSRWGVGTTTDMSSEGVGIRCRRALPVGAHVELIVEWPARHGDQAIDLVATGFVVRSTATRAAILMTSRRFRILPVEQPSFAVSA